MLFRSHSEDYVVKKYQVLHHATEVLAISFANVSPSFL